LRNLSWSPGPPLCLWYPFERLVRQTKIAPSLSLFLPYCCSNGLSGRSFAYSSECARGQILFFFFFTPPRCILTVLTPYLVSFLISFDIQIPFCQLPCFIPRGSPRFSHCQATLLAIRDVHKKLYPGIRESQARTMMALALGAAGLKDGGCLTLFGGA
jgi:hypothetical protein